MFSGTATKNYQNFGFEPSLAIASIRERLTKNISKIETLPSGVSIF